MFFLCFWLFGFFGASRCFRVILSGFGCFGSVFGVFSVVLGVFAEVARVFQGSFKDISRMFESV